MRNCQIESVPREPIFEKCSHLREKGGVLTLRTPIGFVLTHTVCISRTGTASSGNDKVLCLDCDSRRGVGPTKTIRGVFWTQLNGLQRLEALSDLRERSFYV